MTYIPPLPTWLLPKGIKRSTLTTDDVSYVQYEGTDSWSSREKSKVVTGTVRFIDDKLYYAVSVDEFASSVFWWPSKHYHIVWRELNGR